MNTKTLLQHAQFHGAKRLIEPKWRHRFYWIVALALLLWSALSNLSATVARFQEAPTHLETLDTVSTTITFPSVLVCPEVYFPDYKIEGLLEKAKYPPNMTAATIRPIIKQLTAFYSPDPPYTIHELAMVQEFLAYNDLDIIEAILILVPTCEETLLRCRFNQEDYNCAEIFHMEITMYGYCCTFNGLSLERDLEQERGAKTQKWQTTEVGPLAALLLVVNQSQILDSVDLSYKWLVTQNNKHYVYEAKNGTAISRGKEVWSSFHLELLHVSDETLFLGDQLRGCFVGDMKLKYFPKYNKMASVIHNCRCLLPVHYRVAPGEAPLCPARSLPCARKSLEQFQKGNCDCPYSCEYQLDKVAYQSYDLASEANTIDDFYYGLNFSGVTILRIFLKSHQTTAFFRRPVFTFNDLFSQLGGVFNLFFGCSILSILELLQLGWYSLQDIKSSAFKSKSVSKKKRKKMISYMFGICCRAKKGRVFKKKTVKKVTFFKRK